MYYHIEHESNGIKWGIPSNLFTYFLVLNVEFYFLNINLFTLIGG